ncbi:MAG: protein-disulfide reductase DsbD domain-containing protein [Candidatus Krumholzibacteriota bacterium]
MGCSTEKTQQPTDSNPVLVTVQVVPAAAVPGESVTLVWRFDLAEDWHLYWAGRNDSGFPPRIDLELPPGWLAGGLQWPAPERHVSAGDILDHVYFGELVLIQKLGAPDDAEVGGKVDIKADIQWLACRDMCVPGRTSLSVRVPVGNHADTEEPNLASEAAARLPKPLPDRTLETAWEGATFHIHHPRARRLTFMPTDDCGPLVDLLNDGRGDRLALRFKPRGDTVGPVRGLVTIEVEGGDARTYTIGFPAAVFPGEPSGG